MIGALSRARTRQRNAARARKSRKRTIGPPPSSCARPRAGNATSRLLRGPKPRCKAGEPIEVSAFLGGRPSSTGAHCPNWSAARSCGPRRLQRAAAGEAGTRGSGGVERKSPGLPGPFLIAVSRRLQSFTPYCCQRFAQAPKHHTAPAQRHRVRAWRHPASPRAGSSSSVSPNAS